MHADGLPPSLRLAAYTRRMLCALAHPRYQQATERPPPGQEYKVLVGRSTSVTGPFVDQAGNELTRGGAGTLVLGSHDNVYAPGGQSVFRDAVSGRDVIVYHYVNGTEEVGGPSYLRVGMARRRGVVSGAVAACGDVYDT